MDNTVGKPFFESIRRNIKISYFVASIIPLGLLVYLSVKYILPIVTGGNLSELPLHIGILLFLAVVLSVLGLSLSVQTTNKSIFALQTLHKKLNSLLEITKQFRETPYLDLLLENIIRSATDLIYAETGSLLLFNEEGDLVYKMVIGSNAGALKEKVIKVGSGFAGRVAKTGRPLLINKVDDDSEREMGIRVDSVLCVPLIYTRKVIGVIELINKKGGPFTNEDERLLHSLADQAAISISQSKAFETRQSDLIHITEILISAQDGYSKIKEGHARRVARYANLIARKMGLDEEFMKTLYYACLFHDIGFLKIPVEEQGMRERVLQHPRLGYEMIRPISLWSDVAEWILYHMNDTTGRVIHRARREMRYPLAQGSYLLQMPLMCSRAKGPIRIPSHSRWRSQR